MLYIVIKIKILEILVVILIQTLIYIIILLTEILSMYLLIVNDGIMFKKTIYYFKQKNDKILINILNI